LDPKDYQKEGIPFLISLKKRKGFQPRKAPGVVTGLGGIGKVWVTKKPRFLRFKGGNQFKNLFPFPKAKNWCGG